MKNSIQNRMIGYFGIIVFIAVFLLESLFIWSVKNYYIGSVEQILKNRATLSTEFYNKAMTYEKLSAKVKQIIENPIFKDDKTLVEIVDINGKVIMDSNGFSSQKKSNEEEIKEALKGNIGIRRYINTETGERILSAAGPLERFNEIEGAIRYSVSLEDIYKTVDNIIYLGISIGIGVLGVAFIMIIALGRSIVEPIRALTNTAEKMAYGDFEVRASKKYDDEIGKLADTMNYMAEEVQKTEKLKGEFISSISHELRTPLTSIKGWSETLESMDVNEDVSMGMKIISNETERLIEMVEELLDFSRLESRIMLVKQEEFNMAELLEEVYIQFLPKAKNKKLEISREISENTMVLGDYNKLKQVIINLVENSIKFTPSGGWIRLESLKKDNEVVVRVEDSGIGISSEDIKKVREKFFKGNLNYSGSGLGLAIVEEILKLHKGKMDIESEKNKGTLVKFTIPLKKG